VYKKKVNRSYISAHVCRPSSYPLLTSLSLWLILAHWTLYFYQGEYNFLAKFNWLTFILSCSLLIYSFYMWMYTIHKECTLLGVHTRRSQSMQKLGFQLFIISEGALFFCFFLSYNYIALNPNIYLGHQWPPVGIERVEWTGFPTINLIILLMSGVSLTVSQNYLNLNPNPTLFEKWKKNYSKKKIGSPYSKLYASSSRSWVISKRKERIENILIWSNITRALGITFLIIQAYEYYWCPFSSSEGSYGSLFFIITGFHGLHVLIGLILLSIQHERIEYGYITSYSKVGFSCAVWYWHFVDIIWVIVWIVIYMWPN
jgi:heme/copper-type cytochrome/quinol oxidase subunit 3